MVRIRKNINSHPANIALARSIVCVLADIIFVLFLAALVCSPFVGKRNFHAGLKLDYLID